MIKYESAAGNVRYNFVDPFRLINFIKRGDKHQQQSRYSGVYAKKQIARSEKRNNVNILGGGSCFFEGGEALFFTESVLRFMGL